LVRGTPNVLGLENVSFEARVAEPPFEVTVLGVTVAIKFDISSRAFTGSTQQVEPSGRVSRQSAIVVGLD
jgi:hypothetical protein